MKVPAFYILAAIIAGWPALAGQQQEQTPAGVHQAMRVPSPARGTPPVFQSNQARRHVDPERLKEEAEELTRLAQVVPSEVNETNAGRLPKDLNDRLKKIEKLARKLRRELAP